MDNRKLTTRSSLKQNNTMISKIKILSEKYKNKKHEIKIMKKIISTYENKALDNIICPYCNTKFKNVAELKEHINNTHFNLNEKDENLKINRNNDYKHVDQRLKNSISDEIEKQISNYISKIEEKILNPENMKNLANTGWNKQSINNINEEKIIYQIVENLKNRGIFNTNETKKNEIQQTTNSLIEEDGTKNKEKKSLKIPSEKPSLISIQGLNEFPMEY